MGAPLVLLFILLTGPSNPASQIRAAFLYQVAQFTAWPGEKQATGAPIRFCIVGDPGVAQELEALARGRTIGGRTMQVLQVARPPAEICDLAFIGPGVRDVPEHIRLWAREPTLLVGNSPDFAHSGGMVNFSVNQTRLGIEINLVAVRQAGLNIRSQFVRLGKVIEPGPGGRR